MRPDAILSPTSYEWIAGRENDIDGVTKFMTRPFGSRCSRLKCSEDVARQAKSSVLIVEGACVHRGKGENRNHHRLSPRALPISVL